MPPDPNLIRDAFDGPADDGPGEAPPPDTNALEQLRWMATNAKNENARVSALRAWAELEPPEPEHSAAVIALAAQVEAMSDDRVAIELASYTAPQGEYYTREEMDQVTRARTRHAVRVKTRRMREQLAKKRAAIDEEVERRFNKLHGIEVVDGEIVDDDAAHLTAPPGIPQEDPALVQNVGSELSRGRYGFRI